MKFKLTREHIYPWPVKVNVPDPDKAGAIIEQTFNMTFRALPLDEAQALDAEIAELPEAERNARQHDMLRRVCVGWDDQVIGDDNKPAAFSAELLDQMLMLHSWYRIGLYKAYQESLTGRAAELGN